MSDVGTAVVTSFVSALTLAMVFASFWSRQARDLRSDFAGLRTEFKADIGELRGELKAGIKGLDDKITATRTELKTDIKGLDDRFERLVFELLHHFRAGGHPPPPEAA